MSTYLQLVNDLILESGIDLDELTSSNFASVDDLMYRRMKTWINKAWKEIQLERNEWQFKSKQAQITIYPRFLVINGDRASAPPAASTYEGDDSGVTLEVVSTTTISGAWASGTAVAWLDVLELSGQPSWNELFDELTPTPAELNVFRMKWFGRYDLHTLVSDVLEPNHNMFYLQEASGLTDTDLNTGSSNNERIIYVPWDDWNRGYEFDTARTKPQYFTTTPEGYYDFWPRPALPYILTFTYTAEPSSLSAHGDTPSELPADYHDMIMWRAMMYYADFDSKPQVFARAKRRYDFYKDRMESNQMPKVTFGPSRYDY